MATAIVTMASINGGRYYDKIKDDPFIKMNAKLASAKRKAG